jgi:hypothetical protein
MNTCARLKLHVCVFLAVSGAVAAQNKPKTLPVEQAHFSAEDESFKRPVAIPVDVMAILAKQEVVEMQLENEGLKPEKLPASWFSASVVHLSQGKVSDLVVAANPPVSGANTTTFWIFRTTARGHELVLTTMAHDLVIKKTQWKGLREIETSSVTMMLPSTVSYRFDGKKYSRFNTTQEEIR